MKRVHLISEREYKKIQKIIKEHKLLKSQPTNIDFQNSCENLIKLYISHSINIDRYYEDKLELTKREIKIRTRESQIEIIKAVINDHFILRIFFAKYFK